jgi:hypothetical protein
MGVLNKILSLLERECRNLRNLTVVHPLLLDLETLHFDILVTCATHTHKHTHTPADRRDNSA